MHSHSAVSYADCMFVFGGERKGNLLNELWRFRFAARSWDRISTHGDGSMVPGPMSRHAAILTPSCLMHAAKSPLLQPPPSASSSSSSSSSSSWSEGSKIKGQSCSRSAATATAATSGRSTRVRLKQSPSCSLPPAPPPHCLDHKKAVAVVPPKSISMCFGFNHHQSHANHRNHNHHHHRRGSSECKRLQHPLQEMNVVEATRKAIKYFKVHSALSINMCWRDSGITMSDNEEEEDHTSKDVSDNNPAIDGNSRVSSDTGLESESRPLSPPKPVLAHGGGGGSGPVLSSFATVQRRRRKRRPRPFSEQIDPILFESTAAAAGLAPAIEDVDMEWPNFGHKRHTVHESMSYYSLCFPSPQLGSVNQSRSLRRNLAAGGSSDGRAANVHTFSKAAAGAATAGSVGSSCLSASKSKGNPSVPPPPPPRALLVQPPPPLPPSSEEPVSYRKNDLFSPDGLDFTLNEFEEDDVLDFRRMSVNFQQPIRNSPALVPSALIVVGDQPLSPEDESETSFIEAKGSSEAPMILSSSTSSSNNNNCNNNCKQTRAEAEAETEYTSGAERDVGDVDEEDGRPTTPCIFIFGGREERTSSFPQKQPMAVWRLCLNI